MTGEHDSADSGAPGASDCSARRTRYGDAYSSDAVAVVGVGCRLPGGVDSLDSLWRLLEAGTAAIGRMPAGRFAVDRFVDPEPRTAGRMVTAEGGFLEHIDRFDADFFGISPREAVKVDPQHRLLLELTWEALEDAAIVPSSLAGSRTGVYLGLWSNEYETVMSRQIADIDLYTTIGGGRYAASGRISFALDLRGPSLTLDTGCSSSLVALHHACQALRAGEAEVALAGAANLILQPYISVGYSRSGMLSPRARCRFGAAAPDGYVRSEGAVVVALKPLSSALRDGNPIHAVVLGSCVNADGSGSGLLVAPSEAGQIDMLRTAWERCGLPPERVAYVEAHGTGTAAGDGVELRALGAVLGRRNGRAPLPVGSIKTLIGHTEAAAGLAGLLKAMLVLRHGRVPADREVVGRNPELPWETLGVEVVREPVQLERGDPLVVGVNSFGVTGTNAHVVLGEYVNEGVSEGDGDGAGFRDGSDDGNGRGNGGGDNMEGADASGNGNAVARVARVVTVSARTAGALTEAVRRLQECVASDSVRMRDLSYTTTCRREHHPHRLAVVAESISEVREALSEYLSGESGARVFTGERGEPRVGFVFSGQGSQWVGMGRELLAHAPVFAAAIDACEAELRGLVDWSLRGVLAGEVPLDRVDVIQPTLTALQIALARLLESWGVRPAAVVGHSMGEVAAACVAGGITLADAMRVVALRSRLLAEIAGQGAMALVDLPEAEVAARLARGPAAAEAAAAEAAAEAAAAAAAEVVAGGETRLTMRGSLAERVSIAAVNGPRSTVLSGDPAEIDALLAQFEQDDVFCRRVNVDVASHSAQTEPLLPRLRDGLQGIQPSVPDIPFHSTVHLGDAGLLDADYWAENLRRPVRLAAAVQGMIAAGVDLFVEVAPHPILLASLADIAADAGQPVVTVAGLRREEPEQRRLFELAARLHVAGVPVNWGALADPDARALSLPAYPWQRASYWLENWDDWSEGSLREGDLPARPEQLDSVLYQVLWRAVDSTPTGRRLLGRWRLLESGIAELDDAVAAALRGAGGVVVRGEDDVAIAGIIDLRAVAGSAVGSGESFEAELRTISRDALELVQALSRRGARPEFGVWWVTRGAQCATHRTPADSTVVQAALWGLVRTFWQNHAELQPHLIDLEPGCSAEDLAGQILASVLSHGDEAQLTWEQGRAHVARLVRVGDAPRRPSRWRADGSYLLTGGLGEVGLTVAEEMVRGGARRLVLVGRTGLPARERWGDAGLDETTTRRIASVLRLERMGASVHVHAVDVADEAALAQLLAQFRAEQWPEIHGVVHLATTLDNQIVHEYSTDSFIAAVRGKATGAWNLHRLLPQAEHIYFSSVVALLPQSGRASYAAANAVLDALACARRGAGLPAISLAWGVWEDTGLARDAQVTTFVEFMRQNGIESFTRDVGGTLFRWVAQFDAAHVVVSAIDWERASTRLERRPGATFYRELIGEQKTRGSLVAELATLTREQRRDLVRERVRAIAAGVLRMPADALPVHQPLGRRGLDSLMAMELRNRLEVQFDLQLTVSVVWNYPTIDALASYVIARIEEQPDTTDAETSANVSTPATDAASDWPQEVTAVRTHGIDTLIAQIADTADDDVLRMLQEEQ